MHLRARRGFGALVLLMILVVSSLTVLPMHAQGQTSQITGLVSDCTPVPPGSAISGALVTLVDANGFQPTQIAVTGGDGVYTFTPSPGSYNLKLTKTGFFANGTASPIRFDGTQTISQDFCLPPTPALNKLLQLTVKDASNNATLSASNVQVWYDFGKNQIVANGTTGPTGQVNLTLWGGVFELRTFATGYATNVTPVNTNVTSTLTIRMENGGIVQGHAKNANNQFVSAGLQGFLYNVNAAVPSTSADKVVRATVTLSLYVFHVRAPGTYIMVVDANGYQAFTTSVTVAAGSIQTKDATLSVSKSEMYATTVLYGANDWNNLTLYRNLTLNPDTTLAALSPAGLRDLRLQVDFTLGNGNSLIDGSEATALHDWFVANGPFYVTSDGFFTTNGKSYLSATSYSVTVQGLTTAGSKVWINTTATYSLKTAPPYIRAGAKTYFVNVTMIPDSNVSVYQDYVYTVGLPRGYELNTSTTLPANAPVTTRNFTKVTIDPGVTTGNPQIRMTISQSVNGTARAKVAAPAGKFNVQNATFTNYQAFVAGNTTLTYSAEDSTDPNGHISDANFTWKFTPSAADVGYGIRTDYKYTQSGQFTVNLTVREAGGNKTFRDITIFVDDQLPVARIKTNHTGAGNANGTTLRVDEGLLVRFDGGLSTDLAYAGKNGVILNAGYSWDFNGDRIADATGRIVNWTFRKPGNFTVNLTVTDGVGWKSVNATLTAIVNDTKGPVPAFDILDPSKDWATITSPMSPTERKTIALNASRTTDDFDKAAALNFTWIIPGPLVGLSGTNHTFHGVNVTFAWAEWNTSYNVRLSVRDTGFPSGKPNYGNLSRNITVQIDVTIHADLRIESGTLHVSPGDPEEGATVAVTVNVTNKAGRAVAGNVTTELSVISGGQTTVLTTEAQWFDKNGNPKAHTIAAGETVKLAFTTRFSGQGNKTLQVYVFDSSEPYTWRTTENRASSPVNVRQPWWQPYAVYGSVIGVIVLFVIGMYARRKIKAGEWRPIRGRRREKGGEEEKKPRKEVKEEKKRL